MDSNAVTFCLADAMSFRGFQAVNAHSWLIGFASALKDLAVFFFFGSMIWVFFFNCLGRRASEVENTFWIH